MSLLTSRSVLNRIVFVMLWTTALILTAYRRAMYLASFWVRQMQYLLTPRRQYTKVPPCVGLVFHQDLNWTAEDLLAYARVFADECRRLKGIDHLLAYDSSGKLSALASESPFLFPTQLRIHTNTLCRPAIEPSAFQISILDRSDGKKALTRCETWSTNAILEVDLLIVLTRHSTLQLDGFPPWCLRLAEIVHVPTTTRNPGLSAPDALLQGMNRYSRCQQRFGR